VNDFVAELALRFASVREDEVEGVVVDALHRVARSGRADRAYVTLFHDDDTFEISHEWIRLGTVPHRPALARTQSSEFEYSYRLARRGEVFAVADIDELPDAAAAERRSFSAFGVRSVLQVPIAVTGETIGLVGVNHIDMVDGWSDEFIDALARIGSVIGVVLMRHRSMASMRRAYEEVARASRLKDELLTHVSHELRTPLHAILGYAELLELDPRSDRDRDALHQIRSNGRHLLTMVDDLINSAQPQQAPIVDIDVGPVVDATIADLLPTTELRRITVVTTDRLNGATIRASAGRLRQVLYCLLSGVVQTMDGGGEVVVDVPERDLVRLHLGDAARPGSDPVTPLARALIEGHGSVEVRDTGDRALEIDVRFDEATADGATTPLR
jgi:signal transduction histidine kinase